MMSFRSLGNMADFRDWAFSNKHIPLGMPRTETDSEHDATVYLKAAHNCLVEYKAAGNISSLNTTIYLLECAASSWFNAGQHFSECLNHLATALITRFIYTAQIRDCSRAVNLCAATVVGYHGGDPGVSVAHTVENPEESMRSALVMLTEFHPVDNQSTLEDAIMLYREVLSLIPKSHPMHWRVLWELSEGLLLQYWLSGNIAQVEEAISCLQQAQETRPNRLTSLCAALIAAYEAPAPKGQYYMSRGVVLYQQIVKNDKNSLTLLRSSQEFRRQFEISQDIQHFEKYVRTLEEAESLLSWGHPGRAVILVALAGGLWSLFEYKHNPKDLQTAIAMLRESVTLGNFFNNLTGLAQALYQQFLLQGNPRDLDEIVELFREAIKSLAAPHPGLLSNLAVAVETRFEQQGDPNDIEEAIKLSREVLDIPGISHSEHSISLSNLGLAFAARFERQGDPRDVDESIELQRNALDICAPSDVVYSMYLNNLANTISKRYTAQGNPKDIAEAIQLHRQALEARAASHPQYSNTLYNLGSAISKRFKQQGDPKDLDEAIDLNRKVLEIGASSHLNCIGSRHNLALNLQDRFHIRGDRKDIDEAIELHRTAVEMCADTDPHHSRALANLASAILIRYQQRWDSGDLDEGILLHRRALEIHPPSEVDRFFFLHNLAVALQSRFQNREDIKDIDEAVMLLEELLDTYHSSDSAHKTVLCSLASAFHARFGKKQDSRDINRSIELHRRAVSITATSNHQNYGLRLNLAAVLHSRFKQQHLSQDIDEALELSRTAIVLCHPSHPDYGICLNNHGEFLHSAYLFEPNEKTLDASISALREASVHLPSEPVRRFRAACKWAEIAGLHNHSSCLTAYHTCISLLPQLVAVHLDLRSRQDVLTLEMVNSLAANSAACAIGLGETDMAVEFLEASRSIFWGQALNLRAPPDLLAFHYPDFATRLRELSRRLDRASFRDTSRDLISDTQQSVRLREAITTQCRQINEEWEETIKAVQRLTGFEDFMRPKRIASLRKAAISGPVVILLARKSCSALIVTSNNVQSVQLPEMNIQTLGLYADLPRGLSDQNFEEDRLSGAREGFVNMSPEDIFRKNLADIWAKIVKPVFESLNLKKSDTPPRLWWCPTGRFAFIPIHAAGIYTEDGSDCVSDYVVSSYTPTLSALLNPPTQPAASFKFTVVVEHNAPNFSPLPGTEEELSIIMDRIPNKWLTALLSPTGSEVVDNLPGSSIIHFACHGVQDSGNPLNSGLMLSDGRLKVSQIMHKPDHEISGESNMFMSLAFLSACETAKGDSHTPDEAMHLAATLLFSGFRAVVATMWSMDDRDGPYIADAFYEHLFKDCDATSNSPVPPDLTRAAEALHFAVSKLRREPGITFKRWVPFVHYGL
ncbi:CHAT domain-containing protein [Mycena albidolilacea]|uniref:CHAT domain-containing protein n=1 Tax=Mycena albidolilacea TaxID=1033008 RepID=A0AAD6Z4W6_9AGAR|nr:CHAT domain-containing protein [Mycena albidolilacea]